MKWEKVKLNEVCEIIAGQSPESIYYNQEGNGMPFFQGKADFGDRFPTVRNWCTKPTKVAIPNDILLSVRAPVGPTNICDIESCIGRGLASIRSTGKTDYAFVYYFFKSIEDKLKSSGNGSTFSAITIGDVKNIQIPLPLLAEQQAIAAKLDQADALRKKDLALLKRYDDLAQAVFIDLFGDPVQNGRGWEKVKLEEISNLSSGSTPSRERKEYFEGNIPWVKTTEVNGDLILDTQEKITEEAINNSSCRLNKEGSIIIAMYGQGKTRGQVGVLGIPATTNQACCVIEKSDNMDFNFLFNLLKLLYNDLRDLGRGGNQPNLNISILKNYEIILPPLPLQQKFAAMIENIELQKQKVKAQSAKSEELFQALLQESFE